MWRMNKDRERGDRQPLQSALKPEETMQSIICKRISVSSDICVPRIHVYYKYMSYGIQSLKPTALERVDDGEE